MEPNEVKAIVENILLAADEPVTVDRLLETLKNGATRPQLREVLKELEEDYTAKNLQIREVAEGYVLCTRREYSDWIKKYFRLDKAARLSQPALDTLSIVAYKQPLTRSEIEAIRGVDSSGVVRTLLEKNIIGSAGRKKVPGRPMMYRTTRKFLEYFGLRDLSDLPALEDLKDIEISGQRPDSAPKQTKLLFAQPDSTDPKEKPAQGEDENQSPQTGAADSPGEESAET